MKRPVFQDVAVVGGPYPEAGVVKGGERASGVRCDGMAGARLGRAQGRRLELVADL